MDSNYILGPNGELYHSGIKGMRWGIRRYQNKDGSLTPAGKKRYKATEEELKAREQVIKNKERLKAKQDKLAAKKAELDAREKALEGEKKSKKSKASDTAKPKSMKDMTDAELREHINRMQLEKNYLDAQKTLAAANPKQLSAGEKFMKSLKDDVVIPAAKNAGREYVEKVMKDKLGLNKKDADPLKTLENKYKKLEWETKIKDLQKAGTLKETKAPSWDDKTKEQTYLKNLKETQEKLDEYNAYMEERAKRREQGDD